MLTEFLWIDPKGLYDMNDTTLCYIEKDGCYLMLHRVKKDRDPNEGKWIGIGGKVEPGESPEQCIRREAEEETGLTLGGLRFRGIINFLSDRVAPETMYLYTADEFAGSLTDCDEGILQWIPKENIFSLPLWEGDRIFLNYLLTDHPFFHLHLHYDKDDRLISDRLVQPIILASASPRRRELLKQINIDPIIFPSVLEEKAACTQPTELVQQLSLQKASDIAGKIDGDVIVIGADTVVVRDGEVLGKPKSHEEAAHMVRSLQGRSHEVFTGVTVMRTGSRHLPAQSITFCERTEVCVAAMSEQEIVLYADSEEPMDKAGAYGIQGPFAAFIEGIRGDYTNVVGLPVGRVYRALKKMRSK